MTDPGNAELSADFIAHMTRAQRALHAFILTMVWNAADADDVLQETNLVLWRKAAEFDHARPFMPWAMRCAQFQAMAYLKRRQRSKLSFDEELLERIADEAVNEVEEMDARRVALSACLQKLPEDQRGIIAQRYEPGGCVNDMAEVRGTSPKALSEMLRRIRRTLMLCIEKNLSTEAHA